MSGTNLVTSREACRSNDHRKAIVNFQQNFDHKSGRHSTPTQIKCTNIKENKNHNGCTNGLRRRTIDDSELRESFLKFVQNQSDKPKNSKGLDNNDRSGRDQFYSFPRLFLSISEDENKLDPFVLQPSLFHQNNFPPTIYFNTKLNDESQPPIGLPRSLQKLFKWKISSITPNTIRHCIAFMKFETIRPSNTVDNSSLGSWCKHMPIADFGYLDKWKKVNHYPGSFHMGRKDKLWSRLRSACQKHKFDSFHPHTFILPKDYEELQDFWEQSPCKLFIMKPPASARGNGVQVINSLSQIPEKALKLPTSVDGQVKKKSTIIVQQYIANPCLLENGHKFDLRVYVLLTSVDPLRIYVYDEGLVRFASSKYDSREEGIIDQYMHLTNYFVNKNNQDYQVNNDGDSLHGSKWTLKRFWRYLGERYSHVNVQELLDEINDIIIKTIICCEGPMARLSNLNCHSDYTSYELFGFDIILDENFKPWILEVNITPSLKSESNLDTSVKYRVIKDMFNTVGYHLPPLKQEDIVRVGSLSRSQLFFNPRLYTETLDKHEKAKQLRYQRTSTVDSEEILHDLTQADLRVLMLSEDELSRCGQFKRVFPSADSSRYLKYFDKPRYYNLLLDAWEQKYRHNRVEGIKLLSDKANFLA